VDRHAGNQNDPPTKIYTLPAVVCRANFVNGSGSMGTVSEAITRSRAPYVCFKPICDSHLIRDFISRFPDGKYIWIVRNYLDNANSAIRQFPESDRAVRLTCEGKPGGGWLQEGTSSEALKRLQEVYSPDFSKFELSCLSWWIRNNIILEADLETRKQFHLMHYENLVTNPANAFQLLQKSIAIPVDQRSYGNTHSRSISKHSFPDIAPGVKELCDGLAEQLEAFADAQNRRFEAH
jgi:hypothetical protein